MEKLDEVTASVLRGKLNYLSKNISYVMLKVVYKFISSILGVFVCKLILRFVK